MRCIELMTHGEPHNLLILTVKYFPSYQNPYANSAMSHVTTNPTKSKILWRILVFVITLVRIDQEEHRTVS